MTKKTTKYFVFKFNDIFRFSGIALVIWGQFLPKDIDVSGYGIDGKFNLFQIVGVLLVVAAPLITRYLETKKA